MSKLLPILFVAATFMAVGCEKKRSAIITYPSGKDTASIDGKDPKDEKVVLEQNNLVELLKTNKARVIRVPLSAVPHHSCDQITNGDGRLQSHSGGTDVWMEATVFIKPAGKKIWANVHTVITEPKPDNSTFSGRVRDVPVYTSPKKILAIISPAQGRLDTTRHYDTGPFSIAGNGPVATFFGVADTGHTEDFGYSGGGVTWNHIDIAIEN